MTQIALGLTDAASSLMQTCLGMNVSGAEHYGAGDTTRIRSFQAFDHASGFSLATEIAVAHTSRRRKAGRMK
jgi:hypothetical protein